MLHQVNAGGQTGVDRAALDAALAVGLPIGGWCPKGRLAEDGPIAAGYPLRETPDAAYAQRTGWNVRDTDGTLVLTVGPPTGGTAGTLERIADHGRPHLLLDLATTPEPDAAAYTDWLQRHGIGVLNVAGPRESTVPGIYAQARPLLAALFRAALSGR